MTYQIAEKFKSIQGEGQFAGTPMAFIRFVGCSVGKKICQYCDTDFEETHSFRGGGEFDERDLNEWIGTYKHVCLTGGEPLDQDLQPLLDAFGWHTVTHIETSGTVYPKWKTTGNIWVCVSPKPGFREDVIAFADEVKVIVPGLGKVTQQLAQSITGLTVTHELTNFRWPDLTDALRWAAAGKLVYLQPRNGKFDIDQTNLRYVIDCVNNHPQLRLSPQLHKILKVQ